MRRPRSGFRTTIDDKGRVAIPQEIRKRLHFEAGEELTVAFFDGTIEYSMLAA